jgi:hypothetical protein
MNRLTLAQLEAKRDAQVIDLSKGIRHTPTLMALGRIRGVIYLPLGQVQKILTEVKK